MLVMGFVPPRPADDASAAAWLTSRIGRDADWVTATVSSGYPAYARILHPLDDGPDAPHWADVAAQHGRILHPSAQWENISSITTPDSLDRGRAFPGEPDIGNLHPRALAALCAVLRDHTTTPDECWFAVWDGWGWYTGAHSILQPTRDDVPATPIENAPEEWQLDLSAPKLSLPTRDYYLFRGPIDDATRIGHWVTAQWFDPQSPSIFWPDDHAWCVATDIDFDSTLVGGTPELTDAIAGSTELEALPIPADAPYDDTVNL